MLRNMFYTELKQSLKEISGHKYDTIGDFDKLRTAIRIIENEHIEPAFQDQPRSGQDTNKAMVTVHRHIMLKDRFYLQQKSDLGMKYNMMQQRYTNQKGEKQFLGESIY